MREVTRVNADAHARTFPLADSRGRVYPLHPMGCRQSIVLLAAGHQFYAFGPILPGTSGPLASNGHPCILSGLAGWTGPLAALAKTVLLWDVVGDSVARSSRAGDPAPRSHLLHRPSSQRCLVAAWRCQRRLDHRRRRLAPPWARRPAHRRVAPNGHRSASLLL